MNVSRYSVAPVASKPFHRAQHCIYTHTIKYPYNLFIQVSRFQGVTKYSFEHQGFKVWPNIHSSIKVSMWYQIFIWVSRFQCGTKYSFKLDCRIKGKIECIIEGRIIYTVQASKYGCHTCPCWSWEGFLLHLCRINGLGGSGGDGGHVGPRSWQLKSCCIGMWQRLVPERLSWIFPFLLGRGKWKSFGEFCTDS